VEFEDDGADGADYLFGLLLDDGADGYTDWARDYYEVPVDRDAVARVLSGAPLTPATVAALNPAADFAAVAAEAARLGFPVRE
jgi:hypothetical protein